MHKIKNKDVPHIILINIFQSVQFMQKIKNKDVPHIILINIFQSVQFMQKIKNKDVPHIILKLFGVPWHAYPTKFSLINFSLPRTILKTIRFAIHLFIIIACQKTKKKLIAFYCSKKGLKKNNGTKCSF